MATARSRLSWTRWRRSLRERRLARERRRLTLLQELVLEQQGLVTVLEARLHPAPKLLLPEMPPLTEEPRETLDRLVSLPPASLVLQTQTPERVMVLPPEPEEMPDPVQEIAQELGLPPQRT